MSDRLGPGTRYGDHYRAGGARQGAPEEARCRCRARAEQAGHFPASGLTGMAGAIRLAIARAAMVPAAMAVAMQGCRGSATSPIANTPRQEVSLLPSTMK